MGMRIRVLAGCLAAGAAAVILTGTAAQAAPLAGNQAGVSVVGSGGGPGPGGNCDSQGSSGNNWNGQCGPQPCASSWNTNTPGGWCSQSTPAPSPTCTSQTPAPTQAATTPPAATTTPPAPQTATPVPTTVTTSSPPSGAPQTGGGGSANGGGGPLAAGGAATAVAAGLVALFAIRRWRRMRSPAA